MQARQAFCRNVSTNFNRKNIFQQLQLALFYFVSLHIAWHKQHSVPYVDNTTGFRSSQLYPPVKKIIGKNINFKLFNW